jgi:hypothetical protein
MCSVRGIAQKRGNKLKRSSLRINVALAAVTELTSPFLVLVSRSTGDDAVYFH